MVYDAGQNRLSVSFPSVLCARIRRSACQSVDRSSHIAYRLLSRLRLTIPVARSERMSRAAEQSPASLQGHAFPTLGPTVTKGSHWTIALHAVHSCSAASDVGVSRTLVWPTAICCISGL